MPFSKEQLLKTTSQEAAHHSSAGLLVSFSQRKETKGRPAGTQSCPTGTWRSDYKDQRIFQVKDFFFPLIELKELTIYGKTLNFSNFNLVTEFNVNYGMVDCTRYSFWK